MSQKEETPIAWARRVRAILRDGHIPPKADLDRLEAGLSHYLDHAPAVRLDEAYGLHPAWGEKGWWTQEPKDARNEILIEMDRRLFGQLEIPEAARGIVALTRRHQQRLSCSNLSEADLLARLARTGKLSIGEKQVRNIIKAARKSEAT